MQVLFYTLYAGLALTAALAFKFGGRAERAGMMWMLVNTATGTIVNVSGLRSTLAHLTIDGIFAISLLPFAIYFVSWWIGAMALLAAIGFGIEAFYLVADRPSDSYFANTTNALFAAQLVNLSIASLGSAWSRRRQVMKAARRAAPAPTTVSLATADD